MSKLLERIIRDVLNEGRINISLKVLESKDNQFVSEVKNMLQPDTTKLSPDTFGGVRLEVQRIGGRQDIEGKKEYDMPNDKLQSQAVVYLNTLSSGIYSKKTTGDYIWILSKDRNLKTQKTTPDVNAKQSGVKDKSEQILAKYVIIATYVHRSLLYKTITTKSPLGYLDTLRNGALIFDYDAFSSSWKAAKVSDVNIDQPLEQAPSTLVSFNDDSMGVRMLYTFFNLKSEFEFNPTSKYGCELKAAVTQFQQENRLPVTGNYDEKTRDFAISLKKPNYIFNNKQAVIELAKTCNAEQASNDQIKVPPGGFQYAGVTANQPGKTFNDPEFYKVQLLLIAAFEKLANTSLGTKEKEGFLARAKRKGQYKMYLAVKNGIKDKDKQGDFGPATLELVKLFKKGWQMPNPEVVDSLLVNELVKLLETP
jgi:hypothetical protein